MRVHLAPRFRRDAGLCDKPTGILLGIGGKASTAGERWGNKETQNRRKKAPVFTLSLLCDPG